MDRIKKVSFVIPCYRSEHTLPHVVAEIEEKMKRMSQKCTEKNYSNVTEVKKIYSMCTC